MKRIYSVLCFAVFMLLFASCNKTNLPLQENKEPDRDGTYASPEGTETSKYMFMINDKLYVDTGEIESNISCGVMDVTFDKILPTDHVPVKNGEANFTTEQNGAQMGRRENRMTAFVNGEWHIFAYNENNMDGVTLKVADASSTKLTVVFDNQLRKEFLFGAWFRLDAFDESTKNWISADEICEYAAFEDIGYIMKAAAETSCDIDFEWLYGELKPGKYRIVKDVIDSKEAGDYEKYWLMAEFVIE